MRVIVKELVGKEKSSITFQLYSIRLAGYRPKGRLLHLRLVSHVDPFSYYTWEQLF